MKKISIIAPIYNEVDNIKKFYQEISKNVLKSVDYEIIFVDDGSSDKSLKVIKNLATNDNKIKFFSLSKNYGQQTAIFVGLKYCLGQAAIVIDCDLQDPPELIPHMIHFWLKGYKIVLPQRLSRDDPFIKIYSAKFYYFILNLLRSNNLNPRIGEFYLLDRLAIDQIINTAKEPLFLRGKVQFLKFDKFILNYRRKRRASGKSGFSYKKMLKLAIDSLRMGKNNTQPRFEISESNFFKDKKIAIIGAGICGLASAYFLLKLGFKVEIFEKEKETGGLLSGVRIADTKVDRYYHHLFRGQTRLLKLCRELNLNCDFKQSKSSMGYLLNNKIYSFNTIFDYLKLPCLSFFQKIRMGSAIFLLKFSDSSACKQLSASNIIIAKLGFASWQSFWQTLFENKFGAYAKDISASWFIGRLNDRSKGIKQEVLIYPKNGFFSITEKLTEVVRQKGGKIYTSKCVKKIAKIGNKIRINSKNFDYCLSTLPPKINSKLFSIGHQTPIDYFGCVGVIISASGSFSSHYWINVLDKEAPFGVVVEQNNLSPLSQKVILYLAKYCSSRSSFYQMEDSAVSTIAKNWLNTINPGFTNLIKEIKIVRDPNTQPLIKTNYQKPLSHITDTPFFAASMAHIFPQDRGVENAIAESETICQQIIDTQ